MFYLIILFLGTALGSFYHVIGYRMPIRENWISGRSRCPGCGHQLSFFELIPIHSYVIQKGKCRECKMSINPIYVLSEIIAGCLFVFPVWFYGIEGFSNGTILVAWIFLSMLIITTVSDIYYQLILDKVLLFFGIMLITIYAIYSQLHLVKAMVSGVIGFLILYVIGLMGQFLFKKESLGGGDTKLYALVGFVLGILPTFLSIFMSAVLTLTYISLFVKDKMRPVSFGPFIAMASYICLFYGQSLIEWYFNLFN